MATRAPKPIRFEPRWRAADAALRAAIDSFAAYLETQQIRQRRRRDDDRAKFYLAVEAVSCNLLAVSVAAPDRPLALPTANAASRFSPILGKPARKLTDQMIALGLLSKTKGYPFVGPSTIKPTRKLAKHLPLGRLDWSALRLADEPQVVILNPGADTDDDDAKIVSRKEPRETQSWLNVVTAEMQNINEAIRNAPIECYGQASVHIAERPNKVTAALVTLHHRSLRRIFNGTWDHGGRLFGGFWQTMPRADRFRHIKIDGQFVANVDFEQLFLRLAYAEAGREPPPGDLYDVTGHDHRRHDWQRLRDARKKLVNALFFRKTPLKQWPGQTLAEIAQMRGAFPPGTTPRDAIKAIKHRHVAIAEWFERGHGARFFRRESDLIVAVVLSLIHRGIVALPIHDAVLVEEGHAATVKAVMEREAKRLTGATIPAEIETAADHGISA